MRRVVLALTVVALVGVLAVPAEARKRHNHRPAGIEGTVVMDAPAPCSTPNTVCPQPQPQPLAQPVYTDSATVSVTRPSDGAMVASQVVTDGRFRFKLARGIYDVTVVPPTVVPPPCPPGLVCIAEPAQPSVQIANCLGGESKRVLVRRHRFTRVDLHVTNVCVAQTG